MIFIKTNNIIILITLIFLILIINFILKLLKLKNVNILNNKYNKIIDNFTVDSTVDNTVDSNIPDTNNYKDLQGQVNHLNNSLGILSNKVTLENQNLNNSIGINSEKFHKILNIYLNLNTNKRN